jgi:hypothetical protein
MQGNENVPTNTSPLGCLVRLGWMGVGNLILVLCLFGISQRPWRIFEFIDAIYLVTVAALIALRYVDIRYYAGTTSTGEPCTLADWRAYSWRVIALAGAAWCLVRGYAWFSGAS